MQEYKYCIGVMSGTSLDGIDVALCKIKGTGIDTDIKLVKFGTYDYTDNVLSDIKKSLDITTSDCRLLCSLNFKLGKAYADAILKLCAEYNIPYVEYPTIYSAMSSVFQNFQTISHSKR